MPFDLLAGLNVRSLALRFPEKALIITQLIINKIAIPEIARRGSNQPGGVSVAGTLDDAGIGVVMTDPCGETRVPTTENADEPLPVATCVPFVTAKTPVN